MAAVDGALLKFSDRDWPADRDWLADVLGRVPVPSHPTQAKWWG